MTTISKQLTSIRSLNFQSQKSYLQVKEDEDSFIPLLQTKSYYSTTEYKFIALAVPSLSH
jgi:hypothetical protein